MFPKKRIINMKQKIFALMAGLALSGSVLGTSMNDTIVFPVIDTVKSESKFQDTLSFDAYVYSRYVWRGVNFGMAPSIQGNVNYQAGNFGIGTYVAKTMNGNTVGYGNTTNIYAYFTYKGLTLIADDYYFYDEDNLDAYFNWSDTTLHFIETRLKYEYNKKCYALIAADVYGARNRDNDGIYIEGGYRLSDNTSFFIGGVTGKSSLNFATQGGLTNIGLTTKKSIKLSTVYSLPLTGTISVNPNYKNITDNPGVGRNAINMVIGVSF